MTTKHALVAITLLFCLGAQSKNANIKSLGFIAPQVNGTTNVFNPSVGEIVYDSSNSTFYGYDQTSAWKVLGGASATAVPTGTVSPFLGTAEPEGYLIADGRAVSRADYNNLFAVIGTTYGSGDGTTTFNLPDLRGMFIRGAGSQTVGGVTYNGGTIGTKQNDATKKNGLGLSDPGHNHIMKGGLIAGPGLPGGFQSGVVAQTENTSTSTTGVTLTGGDAETRPANMALNYLIKI